MFLKLLVSSAALAVVLAAPAEARRLHYWWLEDQQYDAPAYDPYENQNYSDAQDIDIQEQFNQAQYDRYMREMHHARPRKYQDSYYEPKVAKPKPKVKTVAKPKAVAFVAPRPVVKKPLVKPSVQKASISDRFKDQAASKTIDCGKGAAIVAGYGFTNVASKSCTGATLVFGAVRSGKNFEVNVSSATGELTNVKRL